MEMEKVVYGVVMGIIGIVVVYYLVGALSGTLTTAGTQISSSGLPLASLFGSSGVVFLIIMVALFIAIIAMAMRMGKHK